ncbi:MAG: sigma-54-dependent Fis family transcriptional regulator [Myxococcales bacterium]|nr:sigma-54-dependent Fis family transcriptional regulator [Myxococcales bacterium]
MTESAHILVVDDEVSLREFLEIFLEEQGYVVSTATGPKEALTRLEGGDIDVVMSDLKMPGPMDGIGLLEAIKQKHGDVEVIMMTAFSTAETAIRAMKLGAHDYLIKPFKVDEVAVVIEKAVEKRQLALENRRLRHALADRYRFDNIVGKSRAIKEVFGLIERVAPMKTSVLVNGETGTGKELVAKALHFNSPRRDRPFVAVNCGAIPAELMESELFGHLKGSFTGAFANKKGLFEEAHGGTLFLDEIGELSLALQVKLLRVLQERRVKPIGSTREMDVDVRIVAATNRNLDKEVKEERFRQDLYYRLNVVQIVIPPLRERRDDIPLLVQHFVAKFADEIGARIRGVDRAAMDALTAYPFPGNVRELENVVERAVTFASSDLVTTDALPPHILAQGSPLMPTASADIPEGGMNLEVMLEDLEKRYLVRALELSGGVRTEAAKLLGMSFRSIRYKLDKYDIAKDTGDLQS